MRITFRLKRAGSSIGEQLTLENGSGAAKLLAKTDQKIALIEIFRWLILKIQRLDK